ncbi:MAG: carboxypeptidase-like regulatory domain-containing protein, partial [Bacteroidales bacterium]|nr:carboxypeptidase-like regulatory domain-containing protein [Bacteroidales bacterium]
MCVNRCMRFYGCSHIVGVVLLLLKTQGVVFAQNTNKPEVGNGMEIAVGGIVKDASTKETLPFVTVIIRDENNKLIDNIPTDNSGMFRSFFQKSGGVYTVEIAMIGFEHFVK